MSYFRFGDLVDVPGETEAAVFQGYWEPELVLAKVQTASGRFRSFRVTDIHKHLDISETTQVALRSIREVFAVAGERG